MTTDDDIESLFCEIEGCPRKALNNRAFCAKHDLERAMFARASRSINQIDPTENLKRAMCDWLDSVDEKIKKIREESGKFLAD